MSWLPAKYRRVIAITLFFLCVFLFIFLGFNSTRVITFLVHSTMEIISPFQQATCFTLNKISSLWNGYVDLVAVHKENQRLRAEINKIRLENAQLREMALENDRLTDLLDFMRRFDEELLPAKVIAADPTGWFMSVIINKGSADKIKKYMAVINSHGVVGRVVEVSLHYSKILLATDPNSSIPVLVQRTRSRGIVNGNGSPMLRLDYVTLNQEIKPGDLLVTSGLGRIFPKGLPVGRIVEATKVESSLFYDVVVAPTVDFDKLEEVLVVIDQPTVPPLGIQ